MALLFLDCSSFVSAFPYFPDQQLFKPALWYSGKVEEFEAFFPTIEVRLWRGFVLKRPHKVLLGYNSSHFLVLLHPEENKFWAREGITVKTEKLIIILVEVSTGSGLVTITLADTAPRMASESDKLLHFYSQVHFSPQWPKQTSPLVALMLFNVYFKPETHLSLD